MTGYRRSKVRSDDQPAAVTPEFSRVFQVTADMGSGTDATRFEIEAEPAEREALARRFGLLALDRLIAKGTIETFDGRRRARLEGHVEADVVQTCVVTLEPLSNHIEDRVLIIYDSDFSGPGAGGSKQTEVDIDIGKEEDIEHLSEAGIDVGEAVAECLGLALDPYPRAPGADEALAGIAESEERETRESPFAVLEKLKRK